MDGLSRLGFEAAVEDGEVGSEVGYRFPVGVFVVDGQTTSHVQVAQDDSALAEPGADRVDPFAQVLEHFHASDLRSDVKVQTDDFQMAQSLQRGDHAVDLGVRDAEFVIGFAGRYVPVRHRVDVGIDAQRDASSASHSLRDGVDRFHFGGRFAVEREDILSERVFDFAVGFPDAGENDPFGRKARLDRRADLVPTDAVGSESRLSYRFDDAGIEVGLQRVMYPIAVARSFAHGRRERTAQQIHVVEVERRGQLLQSSDIFACSHIQNSPSLRHCSVRFLCSVSISMARLRWLAP